MKDDDIPVWTLLQHLAAGEAALAEIATDEARAGSKQPICHHFDEHEPIDVMTESREEVYAHVSAKFISLGVDFAADRLEAWEMSNPNSKWLDERIPALIETAKGVGLIYCGWTWEPKDRQPIGASTINVVNNRSAAM